MWHGGGGWHCDCADAALGTVCKPHYASEIQSGDVPPLPLLVDSGGFASIRRQSVVEEHAGLGVVELNGKLIEPESVLALQGRLAEVAYTLDLAVPPRTSEEEVARRERLTITHAMWALAHRRRADLKLFATFQALDAHRLASLYAARLRRRCTGGSCPALTTGAASSPS